jgi:NAD+ synthase
MSEQTARTIDLRFSESELQAHRDHITSFLERTVDDAGADGTVVGLSGGVDSSLTAHLAVEALGTDGLKGLVMPGSPSTDENMSDAERVAEELGIEYEVLAIDPIVETIEAAYPAGADDRMALGNVRVRTRAVLNYYVANAEDRLVLGTGNRTEALVGYFTKYGDGAVDCHPIGNLYKRQVRQLARAVGVPDRIVEKPATAGMWTGQTDEEELGLDYDTLDAILALHVDGGLPASATVDLLGIEERTIDLVTDLVERSAHKRRLPPAPEPL